MPLATRSLASVLLLFLASIPLASAFPTADTGLERAILTHPGKVAARGAWSLTAVGLALSAADPKGGYNYWLATTPEASVRDGIVRARLTQGKTVDCTLLFRATVNPAEPREFSAYGVSIEGSRVVLHRWDKGESRPLSEPIPIADISQHPHLELVVYLVGPQILATLYDADTLALLATLSARDAALASGYVGLRAHDKQTMDTRLTLLAIQDAERSYTPERLPFGRDRLLRIPGAERARVPAGVAIVEEQNDGENSWILTNSEGLERVVRAGLSVRGVTSETPWWVYDSSYFDMRGKPPVRTERGFDLGLSYKDPAMLEALLRGWNALYPEVTRLSQLGVTSQGRPIWALRITDSPKLDENEPAVLLNGGHHGDELPSVEYVLDAIGALLDGQGNPTVDRWISGLDIWCVPMVNPDGTDMFLNVSVSGGRRNARDLDGNGVDPWDGVDLNRNYPFRWGFLGEVGSSSWDHHDRYRGPSPASEVETRAMIELARRYRPAGVLSFHTNATTILSPYTIDRVDNPEPDEAWALAEALAEAAGRQPNGKNYKVKRKLYSVDGTDQDWHRFTNGSAAFIVEGSDRNPRDPERRHATVAGIRGIYRTLFDRVLDGPRVSGNVRDEDGHPLEAEVIVDGITLHAGEHWTSRPLDGRFDRLLPAAGSYTVRVRLDGFREEQRTVDVAGVAQVDVVLRR